MTYSLLEKYQTILGRHVKQSDSIIETVDHIVSFYENIIASMPGNVYWLDKNAIYVGCNQNVLDMVGLKSINDFKGLSVDEMGKIGHWSEEATQSFKHDALEVIRTGVAKLSIESPPIPHAQGGFIYFLSNLVPLRDHCGEITGVVGISIDITKRKKIEKELSIAKEQSELSDKLKAEFIRNMEHDIRTPLSGIWGLADILAKKAQDPVVHDALTEIVNSSKELLGYCNSILEFAKIESGTIPVLEKKFEPRLLIENVKFIEFPAAKIKNLTLTTTFHKSVPKFLLGDPFRLQRIVINLVSNAIKFTEQGSVTISVKCVQGRHERFILSLTVEDTGIGIPQEKQDFIFEKFTRLTASNRNLYKGMGLGLRIVKYFMHEMEGEIELISTANKGTRFICNIPVKLPLIDERDDTLTGKKNG